MRESFLASSCFWVASDGSGQFLVCGNESPTSASVSTWTFLFVSSPLLIRTLVSWRPHPYNPGWSPLEILNLITSGRLFLQKRSYWQATGEYIYWGVTIPLSTEWNQEVETQTSRPGDAPRRITGSTGLLVLTRPWLQVLWECRRHWWNPLGSVLQLPWTIAKQTKIVFPSLYQGTYNQLGRMKIVQQNIWFREENANKVTQHWFSELSSWWSSNNSIQGLQRSIPSTPWYNVYLKKILL